MPAGIQVWDASGNLIMNFDTTLVKLLGVLSVGTSYTGTQQSGSVTDTRFTAYAGHTPFYTAVGAALANDNADVQVSISGNVLSWSYPGATGRPDRTILYGIY
jgi:hypothetical protein